MPNNECSDPKYVERIMKNKKKLKENENVHCEKNREKRDQEYKEEFPLHSASWEENLKNVKTEVDFTSVNKPDKYGRTPLMIASYWGHIEIIKFLINKGADIDQRTENCSSQRDWSALVCAASRKESTDDWSEEKQNFMVEWNFGISDMPFDGYPKTVQLLLRLGTGKNSFNLKKAIEVAKEQKLEKIVEILEYYFHFHLII